MREISVRQIADTIENLCVEACCILPGEAQDALERAARRERSPLGREMLDQLAENARIARRENIPLCQDTGLAVVFADIGQEVHIVGGDFRQAVDEGVRRGYVKGGLRLSVRDPITGKNTGDNTPAMLHVRILPGDQITLTVAPKGAGSENKSRLRMLNPSDGSEGVEAFILETVRLAGGSPCPPLLVGVGLGGSMEICAQNAKRALLRPLGTPSADEACAHLEQKWLRAINALGIGPQGLGGTITALAVHLIATPCHIASLPVAVNLQCHAARHAAAAL